MGNFEETKRAYYGSRSLSVECVTPEFPYCPVCPYGLVEPENPEDTGTEYFKVYCLLNNCYI